MGADHTPVEQTGASAQVDAAGIAPDRGGFEPVTRSAVRKIQHAAHAGNVDARAGCGGITTTLGIAAAESDHVAGVVAEGHGAAVQHLAAARHREHAIAEHGSSQRIEEHDAGDIEQARGSQPYRLAVAGIGTAVHDDAGVLRVARTAGVAGERDRAAVRHDLAVHGQLVVRAEDNARARIGQQLGIRQHQQRARHALLVVVGQHAGTGAPVEVIAGKQREIRGLAVVIVQALHPREDPLGVRGIGGVEVASGGRCEQVRVDGREIRLHGPYHRALGDGGVVLGTQHVGPEALPLEPVRVDGEAPVGCALVGIADQDAQRPHREGAATRKTVTADRAVQQKPAAGGLFGGQWLCFGTAELALAHIVGEQRHAAAAALHDAVFAQQLARRQHTTAARDIEQAGGIEQDGTRGIGHAGHAAGAGGTREAGGQAALQGTQHDAAAVDEGAARDVLRAASAIVHPQAARIEFHASPDADIAGQRLCRGGQGPRAGTHDAGGTGGGDADAARGRAQIGEYCDAAARERDGATGHDRNARALLYQDFTALVGLRGFVCHHRDRGESRLSQLRGRKTDPAPGAGRVRQRQCATSAEAGQRGLDRIDPFAQHIARPAHEHREIRVDLRAQTVARARIELSTGGHTARADLPPAGDGLGRHIAVKLQRALAVDAQGTRVATLHIGRLEHPALSADQRVDPRGVGVPARLFAHETASHTDVGGVGIGAADIDDGAVRGDQARGLEHTAQIVDIATVQVELRAAARDHLVAGERDRAAVLQHLLDLARYLLRVAAHVGERSAHPGHAVTAGARDAGVHRDGDAEEHAAALHGGIREFVLTEARDGDEVCRHGQLVVRDARDIDHCAGVDVDAPRTETLGQNGARGGRIGERGDAHRLPGRLHQRAVLERDRATREADAAGLEELVGGRAGERGLAVAVGQYRRDRRGPQPQRARTGEHAVGALLVLREDIDAARARDAGGRGEHAVLIDVQAHQADVAAPRFDQAGVADTRAGRGIGVGVGIVVDAPRDHRLKQQGTRSRVAQGHS